MVKNTPAKVSVQALGVKDPLEEEMATLLQYSCLENLVDGGAWQATVHGVAESWIQLSTQADAGRV